MEDLTRDIKRKTRTFIVGHRSQANCMTSSDDEAYTQFKFSTDVNTESLKKAINKTKNPESINVVEYGNSINVEIYTDNKTKKEALNHDFDI